MKNYKFGMMSKVFVLLLSAFLLIQCSSNQTDSENLPKDILGVKLEMSKEDAHKRLKEIAEFKEEASKGQEIWILKEDPNFTNIMLGYDKKGTVRYVTVTLEKDSLDKKKRVKFSEIGDISSAEKESIGNINKYMWNVNASSGIPEHQVYTYGEDEENLLHFSLVKRMEKEEEGEG